MPARDLYHEAVKKALVRDGWTITHDPYRLTWAETDMYVDLGAERLRVIGFDPQQEVIVKWIE